MASGDSLERVPLGKPFRSRVLSLTDSGDQKRARLESLPPLEPPEVFERVVVPPAMSLSPGDTVEVEVRLFRILHGVTEDECSDRAALGDRDFIADTLEKVEKADRVLRTMAILRNLSAQAVLPPLGDDGDDDDYSDGEVDERLRQHAGCSKGCLWALGGVFLFFILINTCFAPTPEETAARDRAEDRARVERQREEAEERRKGFHCLSVWSGSHPTLVRLVKENLNDPGSFEHVETSVTPVHEGEYGPQHGITMKFRAKNMYGALVLNEAQGVYLSGDCDSVRLDSVE